MKMIRVIKSSDEWWKKYYKVTKPSIESKQDFDVINEEGRYNLTLIADLEAKPKYSDELGNSALDYGWLVEEKGTIYPAMSVGDRIIPIDLSEVEDCCEEDDYSGYPSFMLEESNFNKTSADNEWWKKYYIETNIEDPDEFQEDYGDYIEKANLTPIAFLEYKDEYESELGNMEPLWLVEDKQGNRFPIVVNMGRVRKVNENKISQVIKRGPANLR